MSKLSFEIRDKDIAARIGKLTIGRKEIETPTLMPVYHPQRPLISIDELVGEFKVKALMTNAYLLLKNDELREEVKEKGLHKFLNFSGIVATDSGSYQLMRYGSLETSNQEILKFEEDIGADIGSFLDIPTLPDAYKPRAAEDLEITLKRAREAKEASIVINAGIQGSTFLDLRRKAARRIGKDFQLCAIGGIVRLAEDYRFSELVDVIATVKKNIPANRVVHGFGLGHPITFSLAIALGVDLLDSAAYALYARDDRYLTVEGTKKMAKLEYLPCCCPVCQEYEARELKELDDAKRMKELARHNLYVTFEELRRIKQAIKEDSLWEFLAMRARAHPKLLSGLMRMGRHKNFLATVDNLTKKQGFYYLGPEAKNRSEIANVRKRIRRVNSENLEKIEPFGKVPREILDIYPFNSRQQEGSRRVDDRKKIERILEYQFGCGAATLLPEKNLRIKRSRKTGRIRWVYHRKEMLAVVRASDHFIIPKKELADKLHHKFPFPKLRVVINDEAVPFVTEGKSVFAKFVSAIDPDLRARDEVLVVDKDDNLLRVGTLLLAPREALDFERGVAVRFR